MSESWADIEGFEGIYQVSDQGRVRSFAISNYRRPGEPPLLLNPKTDRYGYAALCLYKDGRKVSVTVHRLVALAFLPAKLPEQYEVNHIDGVKTNNTVINITSYTQPEFHEPKLIGRYTA
jgi:hypothetical protein